MHDIIASLSSNPYFSAGFGIIGVTASLAIARRSIIGVWSLVRIHCFSTCEVTSRDASFDWILSFIGHNHPHHRVSVSTQIVNNENGLIKCQSTLVPGTGTFIFSHNNRWIRYERVRHDSPMGGIPHETVTMTTLGRDIRIFESILASARAAALRNSEGLTVTLMPYGHEWRPFGNARNSRPLSTVILDAGISNFLINDLNEFLSSFEWYNNRGIPYRRGYLLFGPPGTGKTSFIFALAGHFQWSIATLNLSDQSLTDDRMTHLLMTAPRDSIVVIEDIDAPFRTSTRITHSALLNAIDGIVAADGRVLFATTNHVHLLDAALLRDGRFDVRVHVDYASDHQLRTAFKQFYGSDEFTSEFVTNMRQCYGNTVSMSQVQAHFMRNRHDARAAAHVTINKGIKISCPINHEPTFETLYPLHSIDEYIY